MRKYIGYDLWKSHNSLIDICNCSNRLHISLYDIHHDNNEVYFYTLLWQRKVVLTNLSCTYVKSVGILSFIFKEVFNIMFYVRLCTVIIIWYLLVNITFVFEIQGSDGALKKCITNDMIKYNFPIYGLNANEVEKFIFQKYRDNLSWLEVYKDGSKLLIQFSEKKNVIFEELQRDPLYATKDAVIAYFEVQHGNKLVKINDFVYEGSVLVDAYMLDSTNVLKELYVKGKVYGYTWYTIESTIEISNSIHDSLAYFRLLLDCRRQISQYLSVNESIVKETILHYQQDEGKIMMRVHYTLLEDITIP